jgi:ABC-type lipoprotein export system ATPase subunit
MMDIELTNVVKNYDGALVKALNGVTLTIRSGEIISLLGPSGSGKSTLLNVMSTMDRQTQGQVKIGGKDVDSYRPLYRFRARHIGFVFQFHHLISHLTLLENVELPMMVFEKSRKIRRKKARALLNHMGLSMKQNDFPNRVSGGERQRAAIARGLANQPNIILADEPTGNVDTETGLMVMSFIIDHCRKNNASLIVATHNHELADLTDRKVLMRNGLVSQQKSTPV